ncbi:helix-turn-helix transcriptional regulator [Natrialbaceae archaeon A-CW2]|uniref:helix-turn-helix transcriptional regulator n=1 Tax=Natronosalvus amylolyticus TaxID=2961994 RepID=UPI0020C9EA76|nr:helix-turn-helix domain-containing protein [Natronosalvus amylolyticus]
MEETGFSLTETAVEHRDILSLLESAGPLTSRTLEDELGYSLATVNRHLLTLREGGLAEKTESAYTLTALGKAVVETIETTAGQISVLEAIAGSKFLSNVADAPQPFEFSWLADSLVIQTTAEDPYGLYDRYIDVFENATRLRVLRNEGVTPPGVVDAMTPKLLDPTFDAEGIWSRATAERFMQVHPKVNEIRRKNPALGVYISDESIPIDFSLFDTCLVILSYDQQTGHPIAYIETENENAMGWAADVFAHYRKRSETIPEVFEDLEY